MSTITALNLNQDDDFIGAEWYNNSKEVFSRMRELYMQGWEPHENGLVDMTVKPPVKVFPVKIKGDLENTGLSYWKFSEYDTD